MSKFRIAERGVVASFSKEGLTRSRVNQRRQLVKRNPWRRDATRLNSMPKKDEIKHRL